MIAELRSKQANTVDESAVSTSRRCGDRLRLEDIVQETDDGVKSEAGDDHEHTKDGRPRAPLPRFVAQPAIASHQPDAEDAEPGERECLGDPGWKRERTRQSASNLNDDRRERECDGESLEQFEGRDEWPTGRDEQFEKGWKGQGCHVNLSCLGCPRVESRVSESL